MVLTRHGRKSMSQNEFTQLEPKKKGRKSIAKAPNELTDSESSSATHETARSPRKAQKSRKSLLSPTTYQENGSGTSSDKGDDCQDLDVADMLGFTIDRSPNFPKSDIKNSTKKNKKKSLSSQESDVTRDTSTEIVNEKNPNENEEQSDKIILDSQPGTSQSDDEGSLHFVIDKTPKLMTSHEEDSDSDSDDAEDDDADSSEDEDDGQTQQKTTGKQTDLFELSTSLQVDLDPSDTYLNVNPYKNPKLVKPIETSKSSRHSEIMKKSVITSDFEKKHSVPVYEESLNQLKKQRRKEKSLTKGKGWFDLPATEMTEERKNDLLVLQYRRSLDPKRFYKAPDIRALPKYYQMGTVVESAADFYHSRIPKKQRKSTLVDELLADAEFRKYNKRKYAEVQESQKRSKGAFKHMKRLKKRKI